MSGSPRRWVVIRALRWAGGRFVGWLMKGPLTTGEVIGMAILWTLIYVAYQEMKLRG